MSQSYATWYVWIEWHEIPSGTKYLFDFQVSDDDYGATTAEGAITYVLEKYVSPRDGNRFMVSGRAYRAWAAHSDHVTGFTLKGINQPEYELDQAI